MAKFIFNRWAKTFWLGLLAIVLIHYEWHDGKLRLSYMLTAAGVQIVGSAVVLLARRHLLGGRRLFAVKEHRDTALAVVVLSLAVGLAAVGLVASTLFVSTSRFTLHLPGIHYVLQVQNVNDFVHCGWVSLWIIALVALAAGSLTAPRRHSSPRPPQHAAPVQN